MLDILSEIGEGQETGSGLISVSWQDIKAWIDVTGSVITADEALALKALSSVYVSQLYTSIDKTCLSPNIESPKDREVIANKAKNLFAMLRN